MMYYTCTSFGKVILMRVISLTNGSLISQATSTYALHYAKTLELKLSVVHIKNEKDTLLDVQKSYEDLEAEAKDTNVEIDFILFENLQEFKTFVTKHDIDMLFCSTKHHRSVLDNSFAKMLVNMNLKVDIAIAKIIKLYGADMVENIIMPIKGAKLSVRKFTLFAAFVKAYSAKSKIYSVDKISKSQAAFIDVHEKKEKLVDVLFGLRHYLRLKKMLQSKFSIKHDFAFIEGDVVKSHIVKYNHDLIIIGGHHQDSFFGSHPIDILFKEPIVNSIYFIPYKDQL